MEKGLEISELTKKIPKPMIKIMGRPIIFHIMKHYSDFGIKDFIIAAGYKQMSLKDTFRIRNQKAGKFKL